MKTIDRTVHSLCQQIDDLKEEVEFWKTKYAMYAPQDWVLHWIERYGNIDGEHHKQWLIDQIARILNNTKVIVRLSKWSNGHTEERIILDEPSSAYHEWIKYICDGDDGSNTYSHSTGIAP